MEMIKKQNYAIFGMHEENTLEQFYDVSSRAVKAALCGDAHFGYVQPVGAVTAYRNQVSIAGVGYDISCGNTAVKLDMTLNDLIGITVNDIDSNPTAITTNGTLNNLASEIFNSLSFGMGRKNTFRQAPTDHLLFNDPAWNIIPNDYYDKLLQKAREQLGTIGGGNHYVDVFVDKNDNLWIGTHFGSRGLGHTIASDFLALSAGKTWGDRVKEHEGLVGLDTQLGQDYWALKEIAGQYASVGRGWVCDIVASLIGANVVDGIENHHNDAWREIHRTDLGFEELIVVRKGCTPAFPNQRGFVGGSMGENAVILKGTPQPEDVGNAWDDSFDSALFKMQHDALFSTVHGAGRVMSRTKAKGKTERKGPRKGMLKLDGDGNPVQPGLVTTEMMLEWIANKGVILRGAGVDESPHVYKRLPEVLAAQGNTITILEELRPLIVLMASDTEIDPFKD